MAVLLGVNIDHVATLRQARGEMTPDVIEAAREAVWGGADGITVHLREDRRHIQDRDILKLKEVLSVPLNMEMAATPEILRFAVDIKPAWVCLVPEKRRELTTEGGLDVVNQRDRLSDAVRSLHAVGTKVSFFIEPDEAAVVSSKESGADAVEIHTGTYARLYEDAGPALESELRRITVAADQARRAGLLPNAGHGLDYRNVGLIAKSFPFHEFNIGFSIVSQAIFVGLRQAVKEMKEKM